MSSTFRNDFAGSSNNVKGGGELLLFVLAYTSLAISASPCVSKRSAHLACTGELECWLEAIMSISGTEMATGRGPGNRLSLCA